MSRITNDPLHDLAKTRPAARVRAAEGAGEGVTNDEWYGLRPPEGTKRAWAARAILNYGSRRQPLEFLPDRQSRIGSAVPKKILNRFISEVKRELRDPECDLDPRIDCEYEVNLTTYSKWVMRYNTQASGGYLYMVLFEKETTT